MALKQVTRGYKRTEAAFAVHVVVVMTRVACQRSQGTDNASF